MNRLDDIALFLQVLEHGSISAAARQLDLSAAVASQRLKRLEGALGLRLLHRSTRRLHPTPEGLALAEEGRPLLADLQALTTRLQQHGSRIAGPLRVTAAASFGSHYLSALLPGFLAAHPEVSLSLHLDDQLTDLIGQGFDLGIRIGALADSSLIARKLADNQRVLCAAPAYLQRHGTPATPDDLLRHACLVQQGQGGAPGPWRLLNAAGQTLSLRVRGPLQSNLGDALRHAAVAGLGIGMHSLWHVHEDLRQGRLVRVLPDWRAPDSGIYAVMPARAYIPPRVRAFADYVGQALRRDLPH